MRIFQGLLLLFFGVGLVLVAYQSLGRGWLPFGPNGVKGRLEFRREEQPLLFWLAFGAYATAGFALVIFAARVLSGNAAPLPLR